ncbi:MAG: DUF4199 domain-containing protein [Geothrix sp.]|uniref:DUF4199 domain-containing protein n=1 Tax=Geothrix sp. TaxID=1962974 RepID=UPI0018516CF4|nr:DUF4199 domain-containing protein [Geothrix sp.]NWJ40641.1 DUF4199 domain-containing protein [Geothrix sp.]WIL21350.1 MAG: DUF4199 domain-containing protein [Geothrix sp.]
MHPTLRYGVLLGLGVAAWTCIFNLLGWHRQPPLYLLRFILVVVAYQVALLIWALRATAADGGYGRQVWAGVSISLLGSLIIYATSILFTTVVFPNHLQEAVAASRQLMAAQGLSPEQIEAVVKAQAPMQTPRASAMAGVFGTVMTGLFTSVIAAVWFRKK